MTSSTRRALAAALLSTALVLPATSFPGAAAPAGVGECRNGWQELFVPDASLNDIPMGAVTRKGTLRWVVGGSHDGPMALRWDGARLVRASLASGRRRGAIDGVPATSRASLVGGYTRPKWGAVISPLLGRIVGRRLKPDRVEIGPRTNAAIAEVVNMPNGRGWAVGTSLAGGHWKALAYRRQGGSWRRADPRVGGGSSGLLGVARTPAGKIWAAGWRTVRGVTRPLIARRTSRGWKLSGGVGLPPGPAILTDIEFPRRRVGWAIGYLREGGGARHTPFLQRWNGTRWKRVSLPWDGTSAIPQSLSIGSGGDVWIAGTQLANDDREPRGFVAHRDGSDWTMRFIDTPPDLRSSLGSVDATKDGAIVTGTIGATAIVLRSCEGGPTLSGRPGRKIRVSRLKQRARAVDLHAIEETMPNVSAGGRSPRLSAPVRPVDFAIRDVADEVGLGERTRTYRALKADFDDDGWMDLFISRHQGAPLLVLGGPTGFTPVPNTAFSLTDRHTCDVADVDRDGHPDILCVTGRRYGTSVYHHELSLEPAGPDPRLDRTARGISDPLGRGREVAFIRLDGDAYPEVLVVNQPEREDIFPATNQFYRNRKGRFVAAPGVGLDRPVGGYCADGTDVDGDGDQDLLLCARFPADGRDPGLRVYRNDRGKLRERSAAMGIRPIGDIDVALADVTGDGRRDLIQLASRTVRVSRRTNSGFKRIYQRSISKGVAVAAGDVNGDGRADIYIVRGGLQDNDPDRLLVNDGNGRDFTVVKMPQAGKGNGRGDDVVAIDHDRNGLTDFLVLNGRGKEAGPIQLLAAFPR